MLEDLKNSVNPKFRDELITTLVMEDRGRKLPFFVMTERLENSSYLDVMKTISLNDILEYAERRKLITIHRENFKE